MELFSAVRELMVEGRVVARDAHGRFQVERSDTLEQMTCVALATNRRERVDLRVGDDVLVLVDEQRSKGYIIGIVGCAGDALAVGDTSEEVRIVAAERIELRCGPSSLTMDRDGTVVLRGRQVTSRASGVNKLKGAAVRIN